MLLLQLSLPEKTMFLRHLRSLQKSAKLSAKVLIEICNQGRYGSGKKLAPEDIFLSLVFPVSGTVQRHGSHVKADNPQQLFYFCSSHL